MGNHVDLIQFRYGYTNNPAEWIRINMRCINKLRIRAWSELRTRNMYWHSLTSKAVSENNTRTFTPNPSLVHCIIWWLEMMTLVPRINALGMIVNMNIRQFAKPQNNSAISSQHRVCRGSFQLRYHVIPWSWTAMGDRPQYRVSKVICASFN